MWFQIPPSWSFWKWKVIPCYRNLKCARSVKTLFGPKSLRVLKSLLSILPKSSIVYCDYGIWQFHCIRIFQRNFFQSPTPPWYALVSVAKLWPLVIVKEIWEAESCRMQGQHWLWLPISPQVSNRRVGESGEPQLGNWSIRDSQLVKVFVTSHCTMEWPIRLIASENIVSRELDPVPIRLAELCDSIPCCKAATETVG